MTRRNRKKEENVKDVNRVMREIEDAMHVENMVAFWNENKIYLISAIAGLFVIVTSWQWYLAVSEKGFENQANALWTLEQNTGSLTAEKYNSIIEEGTKGYQAYAWFKKAETFLQEDKQQEALAVYNSVIENSKNSEFVDLAKLHKAFILLDKDIAVAQTILREMIDEQSVFQFSAKEALAISFEKQNDTAAALKQYENIAINPIIPNGMRARVQSRIDALNRK